MLCPRCGKANCACTRREISRIKLLESQLAALTRENADMAARVEDLDGALLSIIDKRTVRPYLSMTTDVVEIAKTALKTPTPGAANRLRIEGMEKAAKILDNHANQFNNLATAAKYIRSRIAEMKGERE